MEERLIHGPSRDTVCHNGEAVVRQDCEQSGHIAFSQKAESGQEVVLGNKPQAPPPIMMDCVPDLTTSFSKAQPPKGTQTYPNSDTSWGQVFKHVSL